MGGSPIAEQCERSGGTSELYVESDSGRLVSVPVGVVHWDGTVKVVASKSGVYITTSLARPAGAEGVPNVFAARSGSAVRERIGQIQEHLREVGLVTDLLGASLNRVDMFKDVALDAPYADYLTGLQAQGLERMSPADLKRCGRLATGRGRRSWKSGRKRVVALHTYGSYTSDQAVMLYHKTGHLESRPATASYARGVMAGLGGRPLVRCEQRWLTGRAVRDRLGVSVGGDLVTEWDRIVGQYEDGVRRHLGSVQSEQGAVWAPGSRFAAIKETHGKGKMAVLLDLAAEGLTARANGSGSVDIEGVRALYAGDKVRKRDLDEVLESLMPFVRGGGGRTIGGCLDELRTALLGPGFRWPSP